MKKQLTSVLLIAATVLAACGGGETVIKDRPAGHAESDLPIYNCTAVNSTSDEFAPVLTADQRSLFFTSNRSADGRAVQLSAEFQYGEAVFFSDRLIEGAALQLDVAAQWRTPLVYQPDVFGAVNTGTMALDSRGEMYISSGTYLGNGIGGADLFHVTAIAGAMSAPVPLEMVNSPWWDAQPAISPDGSMLVFASDRVDDAPSVDSRGRRIPSLWISTRGDDGNWSEPLQLPYPVTSGSGELSPHFSPEGALYFATLRWPEQGYDIVRSTRLPDGGWSEPERLPQPINSAYNDCFPFITAERTQILLASDRPGGSGGYDIWCGEVPYCIKVVAEVQLVEPRRGGEAHRRPGPQVAMQIIDPETGRVVVTGRTDNTGNFAPEICLRAGKTYQLEPGAKQCYQTAAEIRFTTPVPENFDATVPLRIDLERPLLPEFQVLTDTIPFFVTGYWFPNTTVELRHLRDRMSRNELPNANFIDLRDYDYDFAAQRVERWFAHLYGEIETMLVPMLDTCYTGVDTLLISVLGHVDPRGLAWGRFDEEETVRTETMTISPGTVMQKQDGNEKLSHLRAYYTMHMIDREMSARSERFRLLRGQDRIRIVAEGAYIAQDPDSRRLDDPYQRKFIVTVEVRHGHD